MSMYEFIDFQANILPPKPFRILTRLTSLHIFLEYLYKDEIAVFMSSEKLTFPTNNIQFVDDNSGKFNPVSICEREKM